MRRSVDEREDMVMSQMRFFPSARARIASCLAIWEDSSCTRSEASIGDSPSMAGMSPRLAISNLMSSGLMVRYCDRSMPACSERTVVFPAPASPPAKMALCSQGTSEASE